ncbi:MAG TPA: hypothetical protein VF681_11895 [Abditibacteriaceae bacterium]
MATSKIFEFIKDWFGPDEPKHGPGLAQRPAPTVSTPRVTSASATSTSPATEGPSEVPTRSELQGGGGGSPQGASRLERLRFRGARGGIIAQHRSMRTVEMPRGEIIISIGLAITATGLWLLAMPWVLRFWAAIFGFGRVLLDIPEPVRIEPYRLGWFKFDLPSISLPSAPPDVTMWWITLIVSVVLFILSFPLGRRSIPWTYMLRAILFVQFTALAFFAWAPVKFVYGLQDYMANLLMASLAFLTLVPFVLSLTYYIFDVGLLKKLFLTFITIGHLCVLVPLQYLIHAYLIYNGSLLFMPVLYLVFGLSLDVMTFVAFYAWGMSWQSRNPQNAP